VTFLEVAAKLPDAGLDPTNTFTTKRAKPGKEDPGAARAATKH
jgi:hypothetical protein